MTSKTKNLNQNELKWGKENIEAGWTLVPNSLLIHQATLGLTSMDLNVILQIAKYWWEPDKHPYPSKRILAECIGVSTKTIQNHTRKLEQLRFIKRIQRRGEKNQTNIYCLTPLTKILLPYSKDILNDRNKAKNKEEQRPNMRGKPKQIQGEE